MRAVNSSEQPTTLQQSTWFSWAAPPASRESHRRHALWLSSTDCPSPRFRYSHTSSRVHTQFVSTLPSTQSTSHPSGPPLASASLLLHTYALLCPPPLALYLIPILFDILLVPPCLRTTVPVVHSATIPNRDICPSSLPSPLPSCLSYVDVLDSRSLPGSSRTGLSRRSRPSASTTS